MGVPWTLTVALAVAAAAGWAAADEAVQRRGPAMGFMGTRGKKAPSMGFAAMRGKKDAALTPFYDLYEPFGEDKRAMGFMGTRGKKEQLLYEPDYDFDLLNYADKRAPSMGFAAMRGKKAPSGFMGMRGKKGLYGGDYVDDLLVEDWPPREEGPDKRAPAAGFFGTRGKKMPQGSSFFGMRGKKGPSGFVGMRGKKAPASGFMGVRGKKDSDDLQSLLELLSERADRSKRDEQTQLTAVSDATMEATAPRASSQ